MILLPYSDSKVPKIDWYAFLKRPRLSSPSIESLERLRDSSILVTGAGGSIGSALSLRLAALHTRRLILLDASEQALYRLQSGLADAGLSGCSTLILGNVLDRAHLDEIMEAHRPRIVFHAAAHKHVPLLEDYPLKAIANNALGTLTLIESARNFEAARVVLLSTDKAAAPVSMLGVSKRIAEQITLANGGVVLRLGNVLGTEGSVSETFLRQIIMGRSLTITDPGAERYFLTCDEAVDLLLTSTIAAADSSLLVPLLERQYSVGSLAEFLVSVCSPQVEPAVAITGLRPGDRTREALWSRDERPRPADTRGYREIDWKAIESPFLQSELVRLDKAVRSRDLPCVLDVVSRLVPGYSPSQTIQALIQTPARGVLQR